MVALKLLLLSGGVAMGVAMLLGRYAGVLRLMDHPCQRKQHAGPIPAVGGISIGCAVLLVGLFFHVLDAAFVPIVLTAMGLMVLGLVDDQQALSPYVRLSGHIMAAGSLMWFGQLTLHTFGQFSGVLIVLPTFHWLACLLTLLAVVGMINAENMLDGHDGVLAGIVMLQLLGLMVLSHAVAEHGLVLFLSILLGAVSGFWVLNFRWPWRLQAKIFMGDAGSTMIGFMLAWVVIYLTQSPSLVQPARLSAMIWILFLPITELTVTVVRRSLQGASPFHPDRMHIHHQLTRLGFTVAQVACLIYALVLVTVGIGCMVYFAQVSNIVSIVLFLLCWSVYLVCSLRLACQPQHDA